MSGGGGEEANGPREHRLLLLPFGQRMDREKRSGWQTQERVSFQRTFSHFFFCFFFYCLGQKVAPSEEPLSSSVLSTVRGFGELE